MSKDNRALQKFLDFVATGEQKKKKKILLPHGGESNFG